MHKYFMLILQKNLRENCAAESCQEGNLNVSIKTEKVCINEIFAHFFCYLLFITIY